MTTYAVTGATGHLGALTIDAMLELGVAASDIVAIARNPRRHHRGGGGRCRSRRLHQHHRADTSQIILAAEHKATEELLRSSAVSHTILRNNWYTENYTDHVGDHLARGVIVGAAGDGRVAAALRADYAAAAAAVLTGNSHDDATYELGGTPFSMRELAAAITAVTGTDVVYRDMSIAELTTVLTNAGLDDSTAHFVAALDDATARGDLDLDSNQLAQLIGRPTTALTDAVRAAL